MSATMTGAFDAVLAQCDVSESQPAPLKKSKAAPPVFIPGAIAQCCLNGERFTLTNITLAPCGENPWVRGKRDGRMTWVPQSCVISYKSQGE
jgi:hypothetical protein